jgi:hypothetical protein
MALRACIVGAGSSGIAAAKELRAADVAFDCFEASDRVGGNWVYRNKNRMSACYAGLYINTSRTRMEYPGFAMPASYPDFPHHTQIAAYFDAYVDRYGVRDAILFETKVTSITREGRRFRVVTSRRDEGTYDAVLVANGHHWDPRWPDPPIPGSLDGVVMHAHAYETPELFAGKHVVVLGMGNSAMDIAVEASYVADRTVLCSRRGAWVIPKYFFGRPLDTIVTDPRLPFALRRKIGETLMRIAVGDMTRYGLPAPDHRLGHAHPTISGRILDRLGHGAITYRPMLAALEGDHVRFVDGSRARCDVLVYCTGYKVSFPFFDPAFVSAKDNDLPLYRRVFHLDVPGLFFVGLLQPLGAIMPLAQAQGAWIAEHLTGRYALPSRSEMQRDVERERRVMFDRYVASPRHTMQVDYDDYLLALDHELGAGRARARRHAGQAFAIT